MQYAPEALNTYGFGWHNQIGIRYANIHVFKILSSFLSLSVFMSFIPIKGCFFFFLWSLTLSTFVPLLSSGQIYFILLSKNIFQCLSLNLFREYLWLLVISLDSCYCLWRNHCNTVYLKTMLLLKLLHSDVGAVHWSMFIFLKKNSGRHLYSIS